MNKILAIVALIFCISCSKDEDISTFQKLEGHAFGTTFHITHEDASGQNFEKQVDSLIHLINKSLSTYMPNSDISKINNGDSTIVVDKFFKEVFEKSYMVYQESQGWFDPTIGELVNAWGFGPEDAVINLDSIKIQRMLKFVGFDKVQLKNGRVYKKFPETYFDFNALAKGYGVDVIGRFLEQQNITNYMVEIGGEIRTKGLSDKKKPWLIAIESPNYDGSRSFQTRIELKNESVATSGNYRKYKTDSLTGEKYAHIINPKTGFPSKTNLLSVSVISKKDCADVDGYATGLMAMGFERSKQFIKDHQELKIILIYSDSNGALKTFITENMSNTQSEHKH